MREPIKKTAYQQHLENRPPRRKPRASAKPKTYKVIVKPKAGVTERESGPPINATARSFQTSTIASRLIRYVEATDLPEIAVKYEASLGYARPVRLALASDLVACNVLKDGLSAEVRDRLAKTPTGFGLQVARAGVVSGSAARISLQGILKAKKLYERAGIDGFSGVRLCAVPLEDPTHMGIALDLVTFMIGTESDRLVYASTVRSRTPEAFAKTSIQWWEPDDLEGLDVALNRMFCAPFNRLPDCDQTLGEGCDFDPRSESGLRALIVLMCRSQVQLSKMMVGYGSGKAMLSRAFTNVKSAMAERCKAASEILSDEEIIHFWFAELRRLELDDISVPIIRLH